MNPSPWLRRVGWALIAAGVVVLVQWGRARDPRDAIARSLLEPYAAAIREGRTAEAWAAFTTPAYRAATGEVPFLTGHARAAEEWGTLRALVLTPDAPETHTEPGVGRFVRVGVIRQGDVDVTAAFDVVEVEGAWRLVRTWWWPDDRPATERVL